MAVTTLIGYVPDLSPDTPGAIAAMAAVLPTTRGFFRPQPSLRAFGAALGSASLGCTAARYLNGTTRTFSGTNNHLWELVSGTWTEIDGGTTFTPATSPPGGVWRFTVFGNHCIAVNGTNAPQYALNTGNFIPLPGTPPTAKLVASVANNFVVMANTTNFTDQWWTCAQANDFDWVPSGATQSSNGRLYDLPGPITAIVPFGLNIDFALYKETATYLGHYVGPPVIWQFIPVSPKVGALTQESIVDLGSVQVFPSYDDFYMFNGVQVEPLPNPVKNKFFTTVNLQAVRNGTSNILSGYDRIHDIAYWFYPTTSNAIDTWLAWNTKSNLWATGTENVNSICLPETINTSGATALPSVGIFKTDNILYTIDGTANPTATITTGDIGDHVQMSLVTRLRPKWALAPVNSTTTTVTGYSRFNLGAPQELRSGPVAMDPWGWVNFRQSGRWHSFKLDLNADCEIIGLDVTAMPTGDR